MVISLDAELAWGHIGRKDLPLFIPLFEKTRAVVTQLLALFDQYETPVTWAIVGRLLENPVQPGPFFGTDLSDYYPGITNEALYQDPVLNRPGNSLLHFHDLPEQIRQSKTAHEIATHSYNHTSFGKLWPGGAAMAERDVQAAADIASRNGIHLKSVVFPGNQVAFRYLFYQNGLIAYRGPDVKENTFEGLPRWLGSIARKAAMILPLPPAVSEAREDDAGMVNIPGSMLFRVSHLGFRKYISPAWLAKKAVAGLHRAIQEKKILHLWFHPFNFAFRTQAHLAALEQVLREASRLKKSGQLDIMTMQAVAAQVTQSGENR